MRSLLILIAFLFAGFFIVNNFATDIAGIKKVSNIRAAAPFRYAALYAKESDARIAVPIRTVKRRQIADTFGAPRGSDRQHKGQDIFAPRNTPIYSATNGYVYRVGENNLGGNTVWVVGAGGRVYYYAHLEKYAENLKVGDAVSNETVLGYVGTSGNAKGTPPHLHFAVYAAGGAVNPLELFD